MQLLNHQFRLARRPVGLPSRENWNYTEDPVGNPGEGEVLVKVLYISLDPAMRGWMNDSKSYIPPVGMGEVMRALGAGKVMVSNQPGLSAGDYVTGFLGVQEYATVPGQNVSKVDISAIPLPVYLSTLGMTGMTAYFGLLDVGQPKEGDTVVVSGAAGAVGSIAGQIAKIKGCRAVGIAGGAEKCRYIKEDLGFDAAIDYRRDDLKAALREHCPDGVNVYFDNVGGETLDAVLTQLARGARIVICGAISQYNNTTVKGPANYLALLVNRARMEGMMVMDYMSRYAEAGREMAGWMQAGKLKGREHIVEGFETFPETFLMLFKSENQGKLILKASSD